MLTSLITLCQRSALYLLGKGWGAMTVEKEFRGAIALLPKKELQLCVDMGGNKGCYTAQILKEAPGCKVIVFEPAKSNVTILQKKFAANPNVRIEQCAVSSEAGDAVLYSNEDGSGLASLTHRRLDHFGIEFNKAENVKTIRFEDYWISELKSAKIDFCKIDVEGHELDVLSGFGEAIKHISVIQFEFGGCNIDTRTFFQDFWYFFQENGFDLYRISPIGLIKILNYSELDECFITTNYLAKITH